MIKDLRHLRDILAGLANRSDCAEITGYNSTAIKIKTRALDRAIKKYENEALRVKKYYHRGGRVVVKKYKDRK